MILAIFFHFLEVGYTGHNYVATISGTSDYIHISRIMAELIVLMQGGCVSWQGIEITNTDPSYVPIVSNVTTKPSIAGSKLNYAGVYNRRFAKDENVFPHLDCQHDFYLTCCDGRQMKLPIVFMRLLMMLMSGSGYLNGHELSSHNSFLQTRACGILDIGGFVGVNLACNLRFTVFHEIFFSGPFRVEHTYDSRVSEQGELMCATEADITISATCDRAVPMVPHLEDFCEKQSGGSEASEPYDIENTGDLMSLVQDFKDSEDDLLVIPTTSQGRGLRDLAKRVGNLLKGVTQCVTKLHAVWDWPLDTALEAIKEVGEWLAENKNYVDKDVWACTMCPQVQLGAEASTKEQGKVIELLQQAVKKLSATIDSLSNMSKNNMEKIEKDIEELKRRPSSGGAPSSSVIDELDDHNKQISNLLTKVLGLESKIESLNAGHGRRRPLPAPKPASNVGEQMAIPRDNNDDMPFEFQDQFNRGKASFVTKQSGDAASEVTFIGGEEASGVVPGSHVGASGPDELHNAIHASIHLGTTDWLVSSGEGVVLKSYLLPNAIWATNERMKNFASYFQYYTCDGLEFEITTTSIGMQGGTLLVCWDALNCATNQKIDTVLQLSNLPFKLIHASNSTKLKFRIENPNIQHAMCLSGSEGSISSLGSLKMCIANGLNSTAEASQRVAVNVWVRFINPRFNFYTIYHEIVASQSPNNIIRSPTLGDLEAIVAVGKWSTTSPMNLMQLTVHPTAIDVRGGLVTQTSLSVVSHLFARWRGSLDYRFVFAASQFVKGKVIASAVPVAFRTGEMSLRQITCFPHVVCDLGDGNKEFHLNVPYYSVGNTSLVCRDSLYDVSSFNAQFVVSRLHMMVLDSLVMNANASNSISFFVTMRPGKDFELLHKSGVKAEYVDRVLAQVGPLTSSGIIGDGFFDLVGTESLLHKFTLDSGKKNALCVMVAPTYRSNPPCITQLSWLSQIFVTWTGSLIYTLRAHSHERNHSCEVRIWHDCNGSTASGNEFEFLSEVDPPAGIAVHYWKPFETLTTRFTVPFLARTNKLLLPKARYNPGGFDWLQFYNGMLVIDYQGEKKIEVELSIAGGDNFELFEQTVAPRSGNVSDAFTKLSYHGDLRGITRYPLNARRLNGPVNKAIVSPVSFKPVESVPSTHRVAPAAREHLKAGPKEGDTAFSEDGEPITFISGLWQYDSDIVTKQMPCGIPCTTVKNVRDTVETLQKENTVNKFANLVNKAEEYSSKSEKEIPKLYESMKFILPLLKKVDSMTGAIEEKMSFIQSTRDKIMGVLKGVFSETIPGLLKGALENENYMWATIITIIGGVSLMWFCKTKTSFVKKFGILCMIMWSPFLINKVWELGKWIRKNVTSFFSSTNDDETCRKHSMAGTFEGVKDTFGSFTDWFSSNWVNATQSLLTVLGVVASLIIWGAIPDGKRLSSFSAKFKEAGDKGKTFSNIFGGFTSITKICKEWSSKFMEWVLGQNGNVLPKADSALQQMLKFDIREWVMETREMSLNENKHVGFGSEDYVSKIRHLYDRSQAIQDAIVSGVKMSAQLNIIVKECHTKCTELLNGIYTYKGMKQTRIDPIHICMIGAPGVGKSATSHVIIDNLLDYMGEPLIDRVYTRCCADPYWSNYHHEPCLLYDDLGAINSKQKMSDFSEIMGVKTNDPFSVPMAAVDDKGKHCTSKYVFSCTNILGLDDSSDVVTKSAYYRRRNVLIEVERDEEIERSEENPTQGLLFTVNHYSVDDDGYVTCGVKRNWSKDFFLKDIDTTDWVFERVSFKTLMRFLCTYTKAYMESQEKLLKGISSYRINPFSEEETIEAQVGGNVERIITLEKAIKIFDDKGLLMKSFYNDLKSVKCISPEAWNSTSVSTFSSLLRNMCGCSTSRDCNLDYVLKRIGDALPLLKGTPCWKNFILKRVAHDPLATTLIVKSATEDISEGIHPLVFFHTIATYYRFSESSTLCPYHIYNRDARDFVSKKSVDISFEDRIPDEPTEFEIEGVVFKIWPSVAKFFPTAIKVHGFISLWDGEQFHRFAPSEIIRTTRLHVDELNWSSLLVDGFENHCSCLDLVHADDRCIFRGLAEEIENFTDNESFHKTLTDARELYGFTGTYYTFLLYLVEERIRRRENHCKETKKAEKRRAFLAKLNMLDKVEENTLKELSSGAKVALSIAGGIVAVGLLVGVVAGLKSLFKSAVDLATDSEEAESEVSSGGASGFFHTAHVVKGRHKPQIVVTERQIGSAGASANFSTQHVIKGRRKPTILESQQGFGVTYDSNDLKVELKQERRKAKRRQFIEAIRQSAKGEKSSVTSNISRWQTNLIEAGIHPPPQHEAYREGILKTLYNAAGRQGGNPLLGSLSHGDDFEVNREVQEAIAELIKADTDDLLNLVKNGTIHRIEKHAQIGEFGLMKDQNLAELLMTHVHKMSCILVCMDGEGQIKRLNVLRLKGTYIVMPAHYHEVLSASTDIWFVCVNKVVKIRYDTSRTKLVSKYQDQIVWDLGNTVPPSADYLKHIPTHKDWEEFRVGQGVLSITSFNRESVIQVTNNLDRIELVGADIEVPTGAYEMEGSTHTILKGIRYRIHCMPGFCGAAVCKADTKSIRKIIGMHVAGAKNSGVGYAEALTYEELADAIAFLGKASVESLIVKNDDGELDIEHCRAQAADIVGRGNLGSLGLVPKYLIPNVPTRTTICSSVIHGLIGTVQSEPAILSAWDWRLGDKRGKWDPIIEGAKKYGTEIMPFKKADIDIVEKHLTNFFISKDNSRSKREVNSIEIGINGIDGTDFWAAMEMKTSPGYPYVLSRPSGAIGKSYLFRLVGTYPSGRAKYELADHELIRRFDESHARIKEGIVPKFLTMECPKDERRKLKKIYETPATRTFTILPPEINLLFRMYFGDFAAMVMETRSTHFSQVGINPDSIEWSELMNNFLKVSKRGFAGDYAKFDGVGSPDIYHSITSIISAWYDDGPTNARARQCLISSIVHRTGLVGDGLFRYSQGMPSGFSMTVIFNSFVNYYYMALAWINLVPKSPLSFHSSLADFDYYTKLIVYGDDNVIAVADEFRPYYNLQTVAAFLSGFGITYTDDAKNPIHLSEKEVDITSVSFLKRKFVPCEKSGMIWKAPLDKSSIEERIHWIRQCEIPIEALEQNLESAFYEASIHGEAYFQDLKSRVNDALEKVVLPKVKYTFEDNCARWWGNMTAFSLSQVDLNTLVALSEKNDINLGSKFHNVQLNKALTLKEALSRAKYIRTIPYIP
jgi:hypothetical protein